MKHFDIAVIGAGLAGGIAAIALSRSGRSVALVGAEAVSTDGRTTALMAQSIRYIDELSLWDTIRPSAAPLATMQILDGTQRLLRAPPVAFRANEIELEAFGYNTPNAALLTVLSEAVAADANITRFEGAAEAISFGPELATIEIGGAETITAAFVVGADGRRSKTRESAGIHVHTWSYPQTAVVMNLAHSLPHRDTSTEFHTESGPFTQVPLPGNRSSLVWVVEPAEAERLLSLDLEALGRAVETRMASLLGAVTVEGQAQAWPLSGMTAKRYGRGRMALIGEAAHAFPPIGAQGLNLSLRDIMALAELLGGDRPIASDAGDIFDRKRRADIWSRTASVDLLNRSLLSSFLPVQMLRAAGLHVLASLPPLRHLVMQEGVAPGMGLGGGFGKGFARGIADSLAGLPSRMREKIRR